MLNQRLHIAVEEREQKHLNMGSICVSICHDHDFVIIDVFYIKIDTDASTDRMNNGVDFFIFENISKFRFFCVNDLSTKRQRLLGIYGHVLVLLTRPLSRPLLGTIRFLLGF